MPALLAVRGQRAPRGLAENVRARVREPGRAASSILALLLLIYPLLAAFMLDVFYPANILVGGKTILNMVMHFVDVLVGFAFAFYDALAGA